MSMNKVFGAGMLGFALTLTAAPDAHSETLQVMNGAASSALNVPMNRAVVVQSDEPFAELSIANPGIADISTLSDKSIYVLGKAPGRTTLTLLGPEGRLITNVEIHVSPDIAELKERLQQIMPGEKVEVRTANDGIVLSGVVSSAARLDLALDLAARYAPDRVSNLMWVGGTQQVLLNVRFAEVQRAVTKELDGSFGFSGPSTSSTFRAGAANNISGINNVLTGNTVTTSKTGALGFSVSAGSMEFGVLLEALESKGLVRTLAEPNLTALSGQEAKFLAGGEYPIPVANENNSVTVEYKPFGVELAFTPRVVDGDIINLAINAAVSSIDTTTTVSSSGGGGFSFNAFKRREAETTVEIRDGESFAIAGLLQDDFTDINDQVPWLGDVPILGALFRSAEFRRSQTELVVIITPHLVTPVKGDVFALPTDRVRPPTEAELFLTGKTARNHRAPTAGPAAEVARQDFSGSYGYVME
ncbi:MAG: type II and III secretion system protein family protein [Paracoccaceae bacterium]